MFLEANLQLVHKLTEYGVAARPITAGVLQAEVRQTVPEAMRCTF